MERISSEEKPIITCAGNQGLFSKIHPFLVDALAVKYVDWQRSYGRPLKKVRLCGQFVPFDVHQLPRKFDERRLLKDPVLHLYWVDCDFDTFKRKAKDDLFMWHSALKGLSIPDWLIIVVTHDENKVKSKLLRTSVYDKVKSEFNSKSTNRCVLFTEPFRNDPKSEAWSVVINRIQDLMLLSFNKLITKFEDLIRQERERRTDLDWTFNKYFLLQEELAKFYSIIELYEDSLVQYDELDALFAQFIVNHSVGAPVSWLKSYTQLTSGWEGVSMATDVVMYRRLLIYEGTPSLLDIRNYMFSKQCGLLIKLERPSELTNRAIKFIHNTIHELRLLEVTMPPGAVSCWVFLTSKELLNICEPFKETLGMEVYSVYTSSLWTCLQSVTYKLGSLCGLLPGTEPTSEELHSVVQLISGISTTSSTSSHSEDADLSPRDKLKKVLSSSEAYRNYYVELTELTMGTLKYIGHTRMAKLLGQQLAKFYMSSNQPQQAESFLISCLQLFANDQWTKLELNTWEQLADCEMRLNNSQAYIKACLKIATHTQADKETRLKYAKKILEFSCQKTEVKVEEGTISASLASATRNSSSLSTNIKMNIHSKLLLPLPCENIVLSVKPSHSPKPPDKKLVRDSRHGTNTRAATIILTPYSITNEDGEQAIGLECANTHSLLRQKDSQANSTMIRNLSKNQLDSCYDEQEIVLSLAGCELGAGDNQLVFSLQSPEFNLYEIGQLKLSLGSIDMSLPMNEVQFAIKGKETPTFQLDPEAICYIGVKNQLKGKLIGNSSKSLPRLSCVHANVSIIEPDHTHSDVMVNIEPLKDPVYPGPQAIQLQVEFCENLAENFTYLTQINCQCPLEVQSKVFTARDQKFVQIAVFSLVQGGQLVVRNPQLVSASPPHSQAVEFISLNGNKDRIWNLEASNSLSFLWRLKAAADGDLHDSIASQFSLEYQDPNGSMDASREEEAFTHFRTEVHLSIIKTQIIMTRYIKPGIPMSPQSLSRQSSTEHILSPPDTPSSVPSHQSTWQAFCECEMIIDLHLISGLDPLDSPTEPSKKTELKVSYEIFTDQYWAISGAKTGKIVLTMNYTSFGVKLMPLTGGYLYLPEVRLRNDQNEEYPPGHVYDESKLTQVNVNNMDELDMTGCNNCYRY